MVFVKGPTRYSDRHGESTPIQITRHPAGAVMMPAGLISALSKYLLVQPVDNNP